MKKIKLCTLLMSVLSLLLFTNLTAQVTIGNAEAPVMGALLQLKEATGVTGGNSNASKGLGLPRVQLTSATDLFPMLNEGYDKSVEDNLHIGLMVYNPAISCSANLNKGIHIWDGEKWMPLGKKVESVSEIFSFTDGEGNVYRYINTGKRYFMIDNVRTLTEYGKGIDPIDPLGPWLNTTVGGNNQNSANVNKAVRIPNKTALGTVVKRHKYTLNGVLVELTDTEFANKFGFHYGWQQYPKACPEGWRMPVHGEMEEDALALTHGYPQPRYLIAGQMDITTSDNITYNWDGAAANNICRTDFNFFPVGSVIDDSGWANTATRFGFSTYFWEYKFGYMRFYSDMPDWNYNPLPQWADKFSIRCVKTIKQENFDTFSDGEGNTYRYMRIGLRDWMIDNLRTTTISGAAVTPIDVAGVWLNPALNHPDANGNTAKRIISKTDLSTTTKVNYKEDGQTIELSQADFASKFGLMYTSTQAKTACPTGWRLPTALEAEIDLHAMSTGIQYDTRHLKANNIAYTSALATVSPVWGGFDSNNEENFGFNILPAGSIIGSNGAATRFGAFGYLWVTPTTGVERYLTFQSSNSWSDSGNIASTTNLALSVRCIRDVVR